jgi:hypothetical protein
MLLDNQLSFTEWLLTTTGYQQAIQIYNPEFPEFQVRLHHVEPLIHPVVSVSSMMHVMRKCYNPRL